MSFLNEHVAVMTQFFRDNPQVFPLLNDALKTPIQNFTALSLDNFATCWFISPTPDEHVVEILRRVDAGGVLPAKIVSDLCASLSTTDALARALHIGIRLYFGSGSFATADSRFSEMIKPSIPNYGREHIVAFLAGCETCYNAQATGRWRASQDHSEIKAVIDTKFADIALDAYPEFKKSLGA